MNRGPRITSVGEAVDWCILQSNWVYLINKNGDYDVHSSKVIANMQAKGLLKLIQSQRLYKDMKE